MLIAASNLEIYVNTSMDLNKIYIYMRLSNVFVFGLGLACQGQRP